MNIVHFGTRSEYIEISLPESYSIEGWAQAEVEIAVNGFHGKIEPWVDAGDFERFAVQLRALYDTLQGQAELRPLEQQFVLKLAARVGGHIHIEGEAWSKATYENRLQFELEIDQSFLQAPLLELERLAKETKNDA
jgi:hypothetical protein